jgi:hypothetical protein
MVSEEFDNITQKCPNMEDKDCPLYEIRRMKEADRKKALEEMDDMQKLRFLQHHKYCQSRQNEEASEN